MPLAAILTYNELNGSEVAHVCSNRFHDFLGTVEYFRPHLTLPHVRITVNIKLEVYADLPHPDTIMLSVRFEVVVENAAPVDVITGESVDSTAPDRGHPPDQLREMHGLPVPQPTRGPREIGGQVAVSDQYVVLDGAEVEDARRPGLKVSRTGSGMLDGMASAQNATIVKIDQGPAGLRQGMMKREEYHFGGGGKPDPLFRR